MITGSRDTGGGLSGELLAEVALQHLATRVARKDLDELELVGYDYTVYNAVHAHQLPVTVATYWRARKPLADDYVPALFFSRRDGAIVYGYAGATPTTTWYPPTRWQEGEVVRVETPVLSVGRLRGALGAMVLPGGDPWSADDRLQPIVVAAGSPAATYEGDTLIHLFEFR